MEAKKISFKKLRDFNVAKNIYLQLNSENSKTKLGYAIKRVSEQQSFKDIFQEYNTELDEKRIDLCLTDKITGAVLLEQNKQALRPYQYDKEGLKKIAKEENAILSKWDAKEFEIKTYFCTELPGDLDEDWREYFEGIVIKEQEAAK